MTRHRFRLVVRLLVRRQPRLCIAPGHVALPPMAPAPNPGPSAATLAAGLAAIGFWRLSAVAAPHLAALAIMLQTETDFGGAHRFCAGLGHPELLLYRAAAAPGAVGRAVADAGRGAGAAVAAQARRRADDRELRRPDGDRPRHRGLPVHDLSQSALDRGRRRARHPAADVRAVVARSVPHPPPAGAGRQAGLSRRAGRLFHHLAG